MVIVKFIQEVAIDIAVCGVLPVCLAETQMDLLKWLMVHCTFEKKGHPNRDVLFYYSRIGGR